MTNRRNKEKHEIRYLYAKFNHDADYLIPQTDYTPIHLMCIVGGLIRNHKYRTALVMLKVADHSAREDPDDFKNKYTIQCFLYNHRTLLKSKYYPANFIYLPTLLWYLDNQPYRMYYGIDGILKYHGHDYIRRFYTFMTKKLNIIFSRLLSRLGYIDDKNRPTKLVNRIEKSHRIIVHLRRHVGLSFVLDCYEDNYIGDDSIVIYAILALLFKVSCHSRFPDKVIPMKRDAKPVDLFMDYLWKQDVKMTNVLHLSYGLEQEQRHPRLMKKYHLLVHRPKINLKKRVWNYHHQF